MHKEKSHKTAAISFRLDPQIKADLEDLARRQDRSLAYYVQKILQAHVDGVAKKHKT
jgi:predicted DNA-binding protein